MSFDHAVGFKFMELADYLEKLLGKKVDRLIPAGVEGIRLRNVANSIAGHILYV